MDVDFSVAWTYFPFLLEAAVLTVFITLVSQVIGTTLGFFLALGRISRFAPLKWAVWGYVWIFRCWHAAVDNKLNPDYALSSACLMWYKK